MVAKRFVIASIFLAALFGGIVAFKLIQGWIKSSHRFAIPPSTVSTEPAKQLNWIPRLRSVGSIVAIRSTVVTTETAGIVKEITFKSGDKVEKDAIVVRLEDSIDQAALSVKVANSKLAKIQFDRARDLLPKNAVSKSDYDQAYAKHLAAQAEVKQQQAINAKKIIRAPFTGLIGIRKISEGNFIKAGDAIANLHALDPIYFDYTVPERHFGKLKKGQVVNIQMDSRAGETFTGKIDAIEPGVDTGTRTIKVRAILANPDGKLRPGMFGEIYTLLGGEKPAITIPRTAINFNVYGDFIFVARKAEAPKAGSKTGKGTGKQAQMGKKGKHAMWTVERRVVKTGEMRKGRVEILKGLKENEQVVVAGTNKLRRSGQPVIIRNDKPLKHTLESNKSPAGKK